MHELNRRELLKRAAATTAALAASCFFATRDGFRLRKADDRIVYRITKPEWAPGMTLNSRIRWEDQRPGDIVEYAPEHAVTDGSIRWRIIRHIDGNTVQLEQVQEA